MNNWIYLIVAIVSEVVATSALKASAGFTVLIPSIIVVTGYSSCLLYTSDAADE